MKRLLLLSFITATLLLFTSCQKQWNSIDDVYPESQPYDELNQPRLVKTSNQQMDVILAKKTERSRAATEISQWESNHGRSYRVRYYPFESYQNIGLTVFDADRLYADYPNFFYEDDLGILDWDAFSFYGFDRFAESSSMTKKVKGGFSLNLGLFKLGAKKKMTEIFNKSLVESSTTVFGQLDVVVLDKSFELSMTPSSLDIINGGYRDKFFIDDIYNASVDEIFETYGPFVLTGFYTGGKATAVYAANHNSNVSTERKESDMKKSINASYGIGEDVKESGSASLGFGLNYGDSTSMSSEIKQMQMSIRTIGGLYGTNSYTLPASIENVNLDLTPWVQSLNDESNHRIVDIPVNGLQPISEFFLEANLKYRFNELIESEVDIANKSLIRPRITFYSNYYNPPLGGRKFAYFYIVLHSRFADNIILKKVELNFPTMGTAKKEYFELASKWESYASQYRGPFDLNVYSQDLYKDYFEGYMYFTDLQTDMGNRKGQTYEEIFGSLNINLNLKKFNDTENNMIYLLSDQGNEKFAFAIYTGKGDFLLDTYGIRNYVNNLREVSIARNQLSSYTIIAL